MEIRNAYDGDLEQIKGIFQEFVAFHTALDHVFAKIDGHETMFAEYVKSLIEREDATVFVADDNGDIAGYIIGIIQNKPPVYLKPVYGFIDSTAVKESYQRQGTGTMMFQAIRDWFSDQGIEHVELYAALMNPKSTSFWRKMGFASYLEALYTTV